MVFWGKRDVKRVTAVAVFFAAFFSVNVSFSFADDFPKLTFATWGQASYDNDNISGSGLMGFATVGVDWLKLPGDFTVNTFATYNYRTRALNRQYYDSDGPAAGIEFRNPYVSIGADYYWQRWPDYPPNPISDERMQYYVSSFLQWNLYKKGTSYFLGLPGSIWYNATYDDDGISGSGIQGFVHQGIDWAKLPGGITLNSYAEYRWRSRTLNQTYYDSGGPAIGIELQKPVITLGADFFWERLPVLGQSSNRAQIYLTWYFTTY